MNELPSLHARRVEAEVVEDGIVPMAVAHVEVSQAVALVDEAVELVWERLMANAVQVDVLDPISRAELAENAHELEQLAVLVRAGRLTEASV